MSLDAVAAQRWIERWDRQQEYYLPDREERFAVIGDVLAERVGEQPVVVDLGCGPGSLSVRLLDRLPQAKLIGIDSDPVLLELGRAAYGAQPTFVDGDLAEDDWAVRAALPERIDAAVSTTALHWMDSSSLEALYAELGRRVRPGGVFVNADHLTAQSADLAALNGAVRAGRAERVGVTGNEEWLDFWKAVGDDADLGPLLQRRSQEAVDHHGDNAVTLPQHAELLREAGFSAVGTVWQHGDDHVLVALR